MLNVYNNGAPVFIVDFIANTYRSSYFLFWNQYFDVDLCTRSSYDHLLIQWCYWNEEDKLWMHAKSIFCCFVLKNMVVITVECDWYNLLINCIIVYELKVTVTMEDIDMYRCMYDIKLQISTSIAISWIRYGQSREFILDTNLFIFHGSYGYIVYAYSIFWTLSLWISSYVNHSSTCFCWHTKFPIVCLFVCLFFSD